MLRRPGPAEYSRLHAKDVADLMCIFASQTSAKTSATISVSGTNIFARNTGDGRQILVYSMSVALEADAAMVLPLPVPAPAAEDAVRFIDLSGCPEFFTQLAKAFPERWASLGGGPISGSVRASNMPLAVHVVGDFEASFVPSIPDFDRLDARFRLSPEVWEKLPAVADWGFAVFKLRSGATRRPGLLARIFGGSGAERSTGGGGTKTIHPMAFSFPTRRPDALFYPTVHVHDGQVHETARFDHALFSQHETPDWETSAGPLDMYVFGPTGGVIAPATLGYRRKIAGSHPNADVWVEL